MANLAIWIIFALAAGIGTVLTLGGAFLCWRILLQQQHAAAHLRSRSEEIDLKESPFSRLLGISPLPYVLLSGLGVALLVTLLCLSQETSRCADVKRVTFTGKVNVNRGTVAVLVGKRQDLPTGESKFSINMQSDVTDVNPYYVVLSVNGHIAETSGPITPTSNGPVYVKLRPLVIDDSSKEPLRTDQSRKRSSRSAGDQHVK